VPSDLETEPLTGSHGLLLDVGPPKGWVEDHRLDIPKPRFSS
jgi:hypothetical protein